MKNVSIKLPAPKVSPYQKPNLFAYEITCAHLHCANKKNMKKIIAVSLLFVSLISQGQKIANPGPYAKTIKPDDLRKHLSIVAGKEMEGRGTPSPGLDRAASYIEDQFKSLGLL